MPLPLALNYPVYCRAGVLRELGEIVAKAAPAHRYAIISDESVAGLYAARVAEQLPSGTSR